MSSTARKLLEILTPPERRQAFVLLGLMLAGMVIETLGVGLVIPALALMTQNDIGSTYPAIAPLLGYLGNPTQKQLVVWGMFALVGAYLIKTLYLSFLVWRQMKFAFAVQTNLSLRLFSGYLRQPYYFHLQRNSAELVRNITNEVVLFSQSGFLSGMMLTTEILVIFGISLLLLCVEPRGAIIIVTTLGLTAWGVNTLTKKRIIRWGERRQFHDGLRLQYLQEGLGGVKDVKLLGREDEFLQQFQKQSEMGALVGRRQATGLLLPRLLLELFAVAGIAALVVAMLYQGCSPESLLPTLGVFAAAAFRIMPSFTRIMGALQSIQYALPVISVLHNELGTLTTSDAEEKNDKVVFDKALTMKSVGFNYPGTACQALQEVSLSIKKGSTVGFIGESGAGKSTLVDILLGLLTPTSGLVQVDERNIQNCLRQWQNLVGYVPQAIFLMDTTLRRNIAFGVPEKQIDDSAVRQAICLAQLNDYVASLPKGMETLVGERGVRLSGGQRQRIGIARALYNNPEILVFDEATSSLDAETETSVMAAVNALHGKKTIVIIAHRLSTVTGCDRLFRLEKGRVVAEGSPADLLRNFVADHVASSVRKSV